MKIAHLDHLVLTVRDIAATCRFYTDVLGMETITFGDNRKALKFGSQKINLHPYGSEFEPKADKATPGSADLCFVCDTDLPAVIVKLQSLGIEIIAGPVARSGANGPIQSVYIRDPDLNLIELATYKIS